MIPINNGDIEMVDISAAPGQALYPAHGLNHHVEFVSLNTGFMTLCIFNLMVFLIIILETIFEMFNIIDTEDFIGPGLGWLLAMAITPAIWISRSKKMTEKIYEIFM